MHSKTIEQVLKELNTSDKGISQQEAEERLKQYGLNEIKEEKKISQWKIFIEQFNSVVVWILIAATIISAFLKEYVDAIVILVILILIAILGFVQEYRAERAIEALKKLASLRATVIRDGQKREIDSRNLVQGDIIILETGDKVPADARLMEVFSQNYFPPIKESLYPITLGPHAHYWFVLRVQPAATRAGGGPAHVRRCRRPVHAGRRLGARHPLPRRGARRE